MKYDRLKIWFEFKKEFANSGYGEQSICDLWKVAEMFLDEESLSVICTSHSLGVVQEVTNWLEANEHLPEKYYSLKT